MIATGNHYDANSLRAHRPLGIVLWLYKLSFNGLRNIIVGRGGRIISQTPPIQTDSGFCYIAFYTHWCYNDDGMLYHAVLLPVGMYLPLGED